jgi:hypothetical protein
MTPIRIEIQFDAHNRAVIRAVENDLRNLGRQAANISFMNQAGRGNAIRQLESDMLRFSQTMSSRVAGAAHAVERGLTRVESVVLRLGRYGFYAAAAGIAVFTGSLAMLGREFIDINEQFRGLEITLRSAFHSVDIAKALRNELMKITAMSPVPVEDLAEFMRASSVNPFMRGQIATQVSQGTVNEEKGFLKDSIHLVEKILAFRPDKRTEDVIFSLREAFSGEFRSLIRRFDVPLSVITSAAKTSRAEMKADPRKAYDAINKFFSDLISPKAILEMLKQPSKLQAGIIEQAVKIPLGRIGEKGLFNKIIDKFWKMFLDLQDFVNNKLDPIAKSISDSMSKAVDYLSNSFGSLIEKFLTFSGVGKAQMPDLGVMERIGELAKKVTLSLSEKLPAFIESLDKVSEKTMAFFSALTEIATIIGKAVLFVGKALKGLFDINPYLAVGGLLVLSQWTKIIGLLFRKMATSLGDTYSNTFTRVGLNSGERVRLSTQQRLGHAVLPTGMVPPNSPRVLSNTPATFFRPGVTTYQLRDPLTGRFSRARTSAINSSPTGIDFTNRAIGTAMGAGAVLIKSVVGAGLVAAVTWVIDKIFTQVIEWVQKNKRKTEERVASAVRESAVRFERSVYSGIDKEKFDLRTVQNLDALRKEALKPADQQKAISDKVIFPYNRKVPLMEGDQSSKDFNALIKRLEESYGDDTVVTHLEPKQFTPKKFAGGALPEGAETSKSYLEATVRTFGATTYSGLASLIGDVNTDLQTALDARKQGRSEFQSVITGQMEKVEEGVFYWLHTTLKDLNNVAETYVKRSDVLTPALQEQFKDLQNQIVLMMDPGSYLEDSQQFRNAAKITSAFLQAGPSPLKSLIEDYEKAEISAFYPFEEATKELKNLRERNEQINVAMKELANNFGGFAVDLEKLSKGKLTFVESPEKLENMSAPFEKNALVLKDVQVKWADSLRSAADQFELRFGDQKFKDPTTGDPTTGKVMAERLREKAKQVLSGDVTGEEMTRLFNLLKGAQSDVMEQFVGGLVAVIDKTLLPMLLKNEVSPSMFSSLTDYMKGGSGFKQLDSSQQDELITRLKAIAISPDASKKDIDTARINQAKATVDLYKFLNKSFGSLGIGDTTMSKLLDPKIVMAQIEADRLETEHRDKTTTAAISNALSTIGDVGRLTQGMGGPAEAMQVADLQSALKQMGLSGDVSYLKKPSIGDENLGNYAYNLGKLGEDSARWAQEFADLALIQGDNTGLANQLNTSSRKMKEISSEISRLEKELTGGGFFKSLEDGFRGAVERMKLDAQNLADLGAGVAISIKENFGNAFADFITSAKDAKTAFSDMAKSIAKDLAQIASQKLSAQIFGTLLSIYSPGGNVANASSANGGGDMTVADRTYASGGLVTGGSGFQDDVPIMAMGGEYVIPKTVVDRVRPENLDRFVSEARGYSSGGLVTAHGPQTPPITRPNAPRTGGASFVVNIPINVPPSGSKASQDAPTFAKTNQMRKELEAQVLEVLTKHSRAGGAMWNMQHGNI